MYQTNYGNYMSRNKFLLLHRFFHLNDNQQENTDILHKLRPIIMKCNLLWSQYFSAGLSLTLDEAMVKFKGKLKFRQYLKDKPVKWGIKCFLMCDSFSGYCYKIEVYTGKSTIINNIAKTNTYTHDLVMRMAEGFENYWRVIYFDNYYTTIKIVKSLYEKKIGCVGTLRKNRAHEKEKLEDPKVQGEFKNFANSPDNNIILTLWKDSEVVRIINTIRLPQTLKLKKTIPWLKKEIIITKPDIAEDYNKKCRGVDYCNRMATQFRFPHGSRKWWRPIFFHLIQMTIYNSYIIYKQLDQSQIPYKLFYSDIIYYLLGEEKEKKQQNHYPDYIDESNDNKRRTRLHCRECSALTIYYCPGCRKGDKKFALCVPLCYKKTHS